MERRDEAPECPHRIASLARSTRSPFSSELLDGEAEATKFDTACMLLQSQLPKVKVPSLAAFHQLDRHVAAEGFDLSGPTAEARIGAMAARNERDDDLRAAAPYGGGRQRRQQRWENRA